MRSTPRIDHAIVVGGSIAGLSAAAALASRSCLVTLVERRPLPAERDGPVTIAPQGTFPHLLLLGGATALERLVPGYLDDLADHGAAGVHGDLPCYQWSQGHVRRSFPDLGVRMPFATRGLVESRLRSRVRALPNVTVMDETTVQGLRLDRGRVAGIEVRQDGSTQVVPADLVVDASGRSAGAATWLKQAGGASPRTTKVEVGITYTALQVERHDDDIDGGLLCFVQNTPEFARVGVGLAAEGGRWQIVLGGYFGDAAAPTRTGVMDFAASLPDPAVARLLENRWLTDPAQYRFPASRRQHWEKVRSLPAGLAVVGDAVASFNPLYGQGMSSAALQAEALGHCLDRVGNTAALPRAVGAAAARVVASPWQVATGADFVYAQTRGRRPPATDRVNAYLVRLQAASAHDPVLVRAFSEVLNMLAPPSSLFRPSIVRRVLAAPRPTRSPVPDSLTRAA